MFRTAPILAFLAVISSMMMPFGYMPAMAEDGSFVLRICDGTAQVTDQHQDQVAHERMGHSKSGHANSADHQAEHQSDHEIRCNYAVTAAASLPESPDIIAVEPVLAVDQSITLAVLTAIYPPNLPPATGPPEV